MMVNDIHSILVPIDFSAASTAALNTAIRVARLCDASIKLLYVEETELFATEDSGISRKLDEYMGMLARSVKAVSAEGIACSYSLKSGSVTFCILKCAKSAEADMIIMGKHGVNTSSGEFAGTHACQVAERASIPVLIVPAGCETTSFSNILFPVRALLSVPEKYYFIRPLVTKAGSAVTLLTMRDPDLESELHIIHRLCLLMKMMLDSDNVQHKLEYYFEDSCFAEHITTEWATAYPAYDLLVISAEPEASRSAFPGDYLRKIVHRSRIPTLVIHPKNRTRDVNKILFTLEKEMVLAS